MTSLAAILLLSACTPKYDWRDVRGSTAPFTVLLPAKPSTHTRSVNLGGIQAEMTMTAAEIDDVTFAVGTAELPDAAQAQAALPVMKQTLVKNIGGVVRHETSSMGAAMSRIDLDAGPALPAAAAAAAAAAVTTAPGPAASARGMALHARFIARDRRVYQVIVVGREKSIRAEAVDTFLTSFKLDQ